MLRAQTRGIETLADNSTEGSRGQFSLLLGTVSLGIVCQGRSKKIMAPTFSDFIKVFVILGFVQILELPKKSQKDACNTSWRLDSTIEWLSLDAQVTPSGSATSGSVVGGIVSIRSISPIT